MIRFRLALPCIILAVIFALGLHLFGTTLAAWCATSLPDFELYQPPRPAQDLKMMAPDASVFRLSDLKGNVVLLNFWRKDCPYCVQEKAFLKQLAQSINSPEFKIICANLWDSPTWVKSYGRSIGSEIIVAATPPGLRSVLENVVKGRFIGYFVLNEAKEAVYEVKGFPSTYIIDRQGLVVASHFGMAKWSSGPVEKWLRTVLADTGKRGAFLGEADILERLLLTQPRTGPSAGEISSDSGGKYAR